MGAVTTFGRDFVSVRWEGYVMPSFSETYTFWLDVDDHVRLWIDGILLIDSWAISSVSTGSNLLHAEHDLTALHAHEVIMEYREISGNATARLLWSSASTQLTAIPSSSLYYKVSFSLMLSSLSCCRISISSYTICFNPLGTDYEQPIQLPSHAFPSICKTN